MHRRPLAPASGARLLAAALLAALVAWGTLGGCADDPRVAPSAVHALDRPPTGPAPTTPLAPVALASQADFDAFERDQLARTSAETVLAVYEALADGARPAEREADAILLQRLALLSFSSTADQKRLERTFALADRLHREAPASPHTLYLLGYVKRLLLASARGDSAAIPAEHRDVAERLQGDWTRLLAAAPDYQGPHGQTAAAIRREAAELAAALARPAGAAPVPGAAAPPAAPVDVAQARIELWRYERGNPGERKTLCEAWLTRSEPAGSDLAHYLDLHCAADLGHPAAGLAALGSLAASPMVADPCEFATRLVAAGDAPPEAVSAARSALTRAGRPACPALGP